MLDDLMWQIMGHSLIASVNKQRFRLGMIILKIQKRFLNAAEVFSRNIINSRTCVVPADLPQVIPISLSSFLPLPLYAFSVCFLCCHLVRLIEHLLLIYLSAARQTGGMQLLFFFASCGENKSFYRVLLCVQGMLIEQSSM